MMKQLLHKQSTIKRNEKKKKNVWIFFNIYCWSSTIAVYYGVNQREEICDKQTEKGLKKKKKQQIRDRYNDRQKEEIVDKNKKEKYDLTTCIFLLSLSLLLLKQILNSVPLQIYEH